MIISSLDKMEKVVEQNKKMSWDGWTVIIAQPNDRASVSKNGQLINGKWYMITKIFPDRSGWNVPDKYLG